MKLPFILLLTVFLVILGCEKPDPEDAIGTPDNAMPVAKAGPDQTIFLPGQPSATLDGSASSHPNLRTRDLGFRWTQVGGVRVMEVPVDGTMIVMFFRLAGVYDFELAVTDKLGHVAKDTVSITVKLGSGCNPDMENIKASFQLESIIAESGIPRDASLASNEKYIVVAGGRTNMDDGWGGADEFSSTAVVYDMTSKTTTKLNLSEARTGIGIAVTNDQLFFVGGIGLNKVSAAIDIYDLRTKTMTRSTLAVPRHSVSCIAAGTKVFLAGGYDATGESKDVIDILDLTNNNWSVARLSQARGRMSTVANSSNVYFAGGDQFYAGPSARIDIYDLNTGKWSVDELPVGRSSISSSVLGDEILFAGGVDFDNGKSIEQVDFLNPATGTFNSVCLIRDNLLNFDQRTNAASAVVNGKTWYHMNDDYISRFDADTKKWSLAPLPPASSTFALATDGKSLYGLISLPDPANIYTAKIMLNKIEF